jgi:hypothetical protein
MSTAHVRIRAHATHRGRDSLATAASAFVRHVRARLYAAAMDPAVLALLAFGGFTTIPLWWAMGRHPAEIKPVAVVAILCMFLWAPLVVVAVSGTTLARHSLGSAGGRAVPALPIGPRSRSAAEAVVVLLLILVARAAAFFVVPPGALVASTLFGALLVLPLLLAWTSVPRLDWRGLLGPGLVMCVLSAVIVGGVAASPGLAIVVSLALSALVLALAGVEVEVDAREAAIRRPRLPFRVSPGPAVQLRRDRWAGPPRRLGPFVAVVLLLPILGSALTRRFDAALALLGLLVLTSVLLHPFGLRLVSAAAPGVSTFWNGYFGRAWSVLPVPRRDVLRSVYAHGWIAGIALWLLLCGWVWSVVGFDGRAGLVVVA